MALNNFNDKPVENNLDLRCSLCPEPWSVRMDGHKPMCSKHKWQRTDYKTPDFFKKPIAASWHDVGEEF